MRGPRASTEEATTVFRFTGLGWLGLVLPVLTSVAGLAVAIQVGGDIDTSGLVMVVVVSSWEPRSTGSWPAG